jgi:hypothetical protein
LPVAAAALAVAWTLLAVEAVASWAAPVAVAADRVPVVVAVTP